MLLKIRAKPGSKKQHIELCFEQKGHKRVPYLKIWLKSPPKKGKANKELSLLLKRVFGDYTFISGATSREKLIKVAGDIDNINIFKFNKEPEELS